MELSVKAVAFACAVVWGGCVLLLSVVNLMVPPYGSGFLHAVSSVYPGFHASGEPMDVLIGSAEALLDGIIGGAFFALLYNVALRRPVVQH